VGGQPRTPHHRRGASIHVTTNADQAAPVSADGHTLVLGDDDVRALLDPAACVATQAEALRLHAAEPDSSPPRQGLALGGAHARLAVMPGFAVRDGLVVTKVLASAPANRARGLPRGMSTLLLLDAVTGFPLAVMGSTYLTAARTAATAVLAIRTLAPRGARDVGLYGTGPIAELIVRTLVATGGAWSVAAYSPTPASRAAFAARWAGLPVDVRVTDERHVPARLAVVVAATDGTGHAFDAAWLARGATVVSVASRAAVAEVPAAAFEGARVVVDDAHAARTEAAEFADGLAIHGQLGELLSGARPGRSTDDERWIFKATGLGLQDALTARDVFRSALARGMGRRVRLVAPAAEPWVAAPTEASAALEGGDRARA
jgi:ornithine cyclodeaminase/alanine dehydrogenase-like protein (mu-crystallin family)